MESTSSFNAPGKAGAQYAFDIVEYKERLTRLENVLEDRGVHFFIGTSPESMNYFTGFDPLGTYFQQMILFKSGDAEPTLLTHKCEMVLAQVQCWISNVVIWKHGDDPTRMAVDMLHTYGLPKGARIGLEMGGWYLKPEVYKALNDALPDVEFIDVTEDVLRLRTIKSSAEVAYMRKAAGFADLGFEALAETLRPGITEAVVLGAVQAKMSAAGSEYPTLPFIIGSGYRSGMFHAVPTTRVIQAQEPVLFEFTGSYNRYNSNLCRTVVVGKASDHLWKIRGIVEESFWRPFELIKPGAPIGEVDRLSREIRGRYADYIPARAGFGMGLSYPPTFAARPDILIGNEEVFQPGMVVSLEPSIAQYNGLTMSFGYNILITENGAEILHKTDPKVFEIHH
ncbi:Xaa-Pro peptidase family protein [Microvirga sp. VF16]|uniref:M24 family metallopeptidase n=1 Tax=Microvirga sp. VF16 TaxID=2807101 RepID=UPI00193E2D84|nr:Xaa-Pro peptidase family protein [Microvirga sp. VF16]QRM32172.1 aminopeptidase P family protein [Microvirga sp. VF16]